METILLIEDRESLGRMLAQAMTRAGFKVILAKNAEIGIATVQNGSAVVDLVVTDLKLPGKSGVEVLQAVKEHAPDTPVILMTAHGSIELAVQAVKEGAYDFIAKPFEPDYLLLQMDKALEKKRLLLENRILKESLGQAGLPKIIGTSRILRDTTERITKVAPVKTTVLLSGESGTGKELFARVLHMLSPRKEKPFISINCAAIPRELLESELFGHERGAFTGAVGRRMGHFEMANKGTLFLDEIGEMDIALQPKLLRILESEEMMRVGGTSKVTIDVRLVAATNRDLLERVRQGLFREDLYYRLHVFSIVIPPLRERREDIPALIQHFIAHYSKELKKEVSGISPEAMQQVMRHPFTGNVRELQNCIERAIILCDGPLIHTPDLGLTTTGRLDDAAPLLAEGEGLQVATHAAIRSVETRVIRQALADMGGNKLKTAERLQVSYKTLLTKIKEYGLEK